MRTTLQLLPAVNNLYSLNLTPIQLSDLQTGAKTHQALNDLNLNGTIWHLSLSDTILAYRYYRYQNARVFEPNRNVAEAKSHPCQKQLV